MQLGESTTLFLDVKTKAAKESCRDAIGTLRLPGCQVEVNSKMQTWQKLIVQRTRISYALEAKIVTFYFCV